MGKWVETNSLKPNLQKSPQHFLNLARRLTCLDLGLSLSLHLSKTKDNIFFPLFSLPYFPSFHFLFSQIFLPFIFFHPNFPPFQVSRLNSKDLNGQIFFSGWTFICLAAESCEFFAFLLPPRQSYICLTHLPSSRKKYSQVDA